jgi:hypothetical protein
MNKTTVLSCHRYLINTGVEKILQLNIYIYNNIEHQMSVSKSKCWYSSNCSHFLKCAVPLKKHFVTNLNKFLQVVETTVATM